MPNTFSDFRRLRRLRQAPWVRNLLSETLLKPQDLIWPVFVRGQDTPKDIPSLPGIERLTIDQLRRIVPTLLELGIPAITLFPVIPTSLKHPEGTEALNPKNLLYQAIRFLKSEFPGLGVICDVALDPYTSHGHDGIFVKGTVLNDETVTILCKQALLLAEAGADALSPSDMMDGRIKAIRRALDQAGYKKTLIISYAVKYASCLYAPFRQAMNIEKLEGDKKSYQLPPPNVREALLEVIEDVNEHADMLIIKPGLSYLDVLYRATQETLLPILSYQVSGEYVMIKLAGMHTHIDAHDLMLESLISMKRAGARAIISYGALEVAEFLKHHHA